MNKTTNENILAALKQINDDELVRSCHRIDICDSNSDGEYFVEVELLRKRDYRPWRRFLIANRVCEEVALLHAIIAKKCFIGECKQLSDEERSASRKREKRIRRRERKMNKHNSTENNND